MAQLPRFQALTPILGEAHRRYQLDGRLAKLPIAPWTRRRFLRLAAEVILQKIRQEAFSRFLILTTFGGQ